LNKYQQANEPIRLSEEQKEAILNHALRAEIQPAGRTVPGFYRWAGVLAGAFAVLLLILLPGRMKPASSDAPAMNETMAMESREENALDHESAEYDSAAAAAEPCDALQLAAELGCPVPDFSSYPNVRAVEYTRISAAAGTVYVAAEQGEFVLLIEALPKSDETAAEGEEETEVLYEDDEVRYSLLDARSLSEAGKDELKGFLNR
jgi:hypothetical protein